MGASELAVGRSVSSTPPSLPLLPLFWESRFCLSRFRTRKHLDIASFVHDSCRSLNRGDLSIKFRRRRHFRWTPSRRSLRSEADLLVFKPVYSLVSYDHGKTRRSQRDKERGKKGKSETRWPWRAVTNRFALRGGR